LGGKKELRTMQSESHGGTFKTFENQMRSSKKGEINRPERFRVATGRKGGGERGRQSKFGGETRNAGSLHEAIRESFKYHARRVDRILKPR